MSQKEEFVTDEQLAITVFICTKILSPILQIFAMLANGLNISTFCKIGCKDSVNVTFLALSLSDLVYILFDALNTICFLLATSPWQREIPVSMFSLGGCIYTYQYIFLETSTCLETYLAVTRCCCVAMPLKFKNVFTLRRSVATIMIVFVCNLVFRIPLLSSYGLSWQTSSRTNLTKLSFYYTGNYDVFNRVEQTVARTAFPVVLLVIAVVCCVILAKSLAEASLKRKQMTHQSVGEENPHMTKNFDGRNKTAAVEAVTAGAMRNKEVQLVKAVTLVTILLGTSLFIISLFSMSEAFVPGFYSGQRFKNLHNVLGILVNLLITLHAGSKIFIYYTYNARYRTLVMENIAYLLV